MLSFAYRIPPGTPATLFFNVEGKGWICLGKSPAGDYSTYPYVNGFDLVDDDTWHTVSLNIYDAVRQYWPDAAGRITEVEWWTNSNGLNGQQFWFDDFKMSKRTYISGFDVSLLPSTGGNGRGMDAADVNRDGNMDFARARYSDGIIHLYNGDGAGGFTTANIADPGSDPYGVVLADFDEDGKIDLIAEDGSGGNPYFFKGNGNGSFQAGTYIASLDSDRHTSYGVYDFNNDGHQDIVAVNNNGRQVLYYPETGTPLLAHLSRSVQLLMIPWACQLRQAGWSASPLPWPPRTKPLSMKTNRSRSMHLCPMMTGPLWPLSGILATAQPTADLFRAILPSATRFTHEGNYKILVTAVDDEGNRDRRRLNLVVKGTPPVARPGGSYIAGEERSVEGPLGGLRSTAVDLPTLKRPSLGTNGILTLPTASLSRLTR